MSTVDDRIYALERQHIWQAVSRIMQPEAVEFWFSNFVPRLGATPNNALAAGRFQDVAHVVNSYLTGEFA